MMKKPSKLSIKICEHPITNLNFTMGLVGNTISTNNS